MDPQWQRVKNIVADTLERPEAEWTRFASEACGGDEALRREVTAMLSAAVEAGAFLERGPVLPAALRPLAPGTRIGPYTVEALIGEGGFSEVYRVRQEHPVERLLALKLLKPGMDSRAVLTRFAAERQTLARLDHAHIARLYDAGATEAGRPYFVMELVAGSTLPEHADRLRLDARARVELLLQVCDAVEHAHRRGVIHRDLKPSNVLVEVHDGAARAKVIDFGIAKLLGRGADEPAARTATGALLGTPAYASPEQLDDEADVDTRSDVYALGVLLYEALTGRRPTDDASRSPVVIEEIVRRVREIDPRPPSTRRAADGTPQRAPGVARIDRELDWIALRALSRARDRRYASVEALATDLRRHLAGDLIAAGPPTASYRFAKFARRHRLLLASGALAGTALLVGGTAALVGLGQAHDANAQLREVADRETAARRDAESALREAEAVGGFLSDLLRSAQPAAAGKDVKVADLLAASEPRFAALEGYPDADARLHRVVGETWSGLGDYAAAAHHLQAAVEILTREHGPDDWRRLEALFELASVRYREGRIEEGEPLVVEVENRARSTRGVDHPLARRLWDMRAKAAFERGRYDQAAEALRGLLAVDEAGRRQDAVIATLGNLAQVLLSSGQRDEAAALAARGRDLALELHGRSHPLTIAATRKFAAVQMFDHDYAGLIATLEPLLELARARLGPDHPDTLGIGNYLANGYQQTGRIDAAEALYRRVVQQQEARLGPLHSQVLMTLNNLGTLLESRGALEDAEHFLRLAAARFLEARGPDHPDTQLAAFYLARTIAGQGRHEEVAAAYAQAVRRLRDLLGDDSGRTRGARLDWARHLMALARIQRATGATDAAAVTWRSAYDTAMAVDDVPTRTAAATALATLAAERGDAAEEERWRAAAR